MRPHVVHCHNLHGGYFDLSSLPMLSLKVPVILNLHDTWLLTGHCANFFHCLRWKIGCGECPDLKIPPPLFRDGTSSNWLRKKRIYAQSKLYVTTPSQWLMNCVKESMLKAVDYRVIPNGVDIRIFHPRDKREARSILGLPPEQKILLFSSYLTRSNVWKDYVVMEEAVRMLSARARDQKVLFLCLGEEGPPKRLGTVTVSHLAYERDPNRVALYYQASDLYIHAAKAEVFGRSIVEALACGTPGVASAVGGIPEVVKGLEGDLWKTGDHGYGVRDATGILVPGGDPESMAAAIQLLLKDEELRIHLGLNAASDVRRRFTLDHQVDAFLGWYREILEEWREEKGATVEKPSQLQERNS